MKELESAYQKFELATSCSQDIFSVKKPIEIKTCLIIKKKNENKKIKSKEQTPSQNIFFFCQVRAHNGTKEARSI